MSSSSQRDLILFQLLMLWAWNFLFFLCPFIALLLYPSHIKFNHSLYLSLSRSSFLLFVVYFARFEINLSIQSTISLPGFSLPSKVPLFMSRPMIGQLRRFFCIREPTTATMCDDVNSRESLLDAAFSERTHHARRCYAAERYDVTVLTRTTARERLLGWAPPEWRPPHAVPPYRVCAYTRDTNWEQVDAQNREGEEVLRESKRRDGGEEGRKTRREGGVNGGCATCAQACCDFLWGVAAAALPIRLPRCMF